MENAGFTIFDGLVWGGAVLSVLGLIGLVICILRVIRARRSGLSDEELRTAVQAVVPLNLGALFVSVIGLMLVMLGISFG